jgi:DnaK suppressor protein
LSFLATRAIIKANKTPGFIFLTQEFKCNNMEKELDEKVINEIKQDLLARKEQISGELEELSKKDDHEADNMVAAFPEYGSKPDENAQEITDYTTNLATEKILEKTLGDINGALSRIEAGTYGICKYCKQPISVKRLIARPVASACMTCKTELQENE